MKRDLKKPLALAHEIVRPLAHTALVPVIGGALAASSRGDTQGQGYCPGSGNGCDVYVNKRPM